MFRETWQLNTVPAANDNMQVRVTLKGVATSVDEGESRFRHTSWRMSACPPQAILALVAFFKHPPAHCFVPVRCAHSPATGGPPASPGGRASRRRCRCCRGGAVEAAPTPQPRGTDGAGCTWLQPAHQCPLGGGGCSTRLFQRLASRCLHRCLRFTLTCCCVLPPLVLPPRTLRPLVS